MFSPVRARAFPAPQRRTCGISSALYARSNDGRFSSVAAYSLVRAGKAGGSRVLRPCAPCALACVPQSAARPFPKRRPPFPIHCRMERPFGLLRGVPARLKPFAQRGMHGGIRGESGGGIREKTHQARFFRRARFFHAESVPFARTTGVSFVNPLGKVAARKQIRVVRHRHTRFNRFLVHRNFFGEAARAQIAAPLAVVSRKRQAVIIARRKADASPLDKHGLPDYTT